MSTESGRIEVVVHDDAEDRAGRIAMLTSVAGRGSYTANPSRQNGRWAVGTGQALEVRARWGNDNRRQDRDGMVS
ncbi:hypothetical protein AMK13_32835 [Streptomyces sp. CB02056]|nr:hypothetical protein AMK13_32835 [Streptomyces sp. CB02056]